MLANSGSHEWTQVPKSTSGSLGQVTRIMGKGFGVSATLQCIVRVNTTL